LAVVVDTALAFKELPALRQFLGSFPPVLETERVIPQVSELRTRCAFGSNPMSSEGFMAVIPAFMNLLAVSLSGDNPGILGGSKVRRSSCPSQGGDDTWIASLRSKQCASDRKGVICSFAVGI
jgi:hypothetical protein